MKKIIAMALALMLVFTLVACGGGDSQDNEKSIEEQVETAVVGRAKAHCAVYYSNVKSTSVNCTTIKNTSGDQYVVYGYVIVTDNYGDRYKGNFDATVTASSSGVVVNSFDLDKPKKQ